MAKPGDCVFKHIKPPQKHYCCHIDTKNHPIKNILWLTASRKCWNYNFLPTVNLMLISLG